MLKVLEEQWQVEKDTGLVTVAAPVLGDSLGFRAVIFHPMVTICYNGWPGG